MGSDDRNEGTAPGECVEHAWVVRALTTAADGTHVEHGCVRCPAVMLEGPDELAGRV